MCFFIVLKFKVTASYQPQSFSATLLRLSQLFITDILDIQSSCQNLQCILVTWYFVVAFTKSGQQKRMIQFTFFDFIYFWVFLQPECQMINGLFVAFVVEVGLANMMMCSYQTKLWFAMGINQNLGRFYVTLHNASSFIRSLTIYSSVWSPILLNRWANLASRSALIVSKSMMLYPLASKMWPLIPWWSLIIIHQVILSTYDNLHVRSTTFLRLDIEFFFIVVFEMILLEVFGVYICHFD